MKCTFCGDEIKPGTGKMFVKSDGKIYYFCSTKCEKNVFKLKRQARLVPWTKEYAQSKQPKKDTAKAAKKGK